MNGREKSVPVVVAVKSMNEAGQPGEEWMEPGAGAKGNTGLAKHAPNTASQHRARVSQALGRIRQAIYSRLPSNTRGGSRMRECRTYRLCAGVHSNMRPYRDPNYPF